MLTVNYADSANLPSIGQILALQHVDADDWSSTRFADAHFTFTAAGVLSAPGATAGPPSIGAIGYDVVGTKVLLPIDGPLGGPRYDPSAGFPDPLPDVETPEGWALTVDLAIAYGIIIASYATDETRALLAPRFKLNDATGTPDQWAGDDGIAAGLGYLLGRGMAWAHEPTRDYQGSWAPQWRADTDDIAAIYEELHIGTTWTHDPKGLPQSGLAATYGPKREGWVLNDWRAQNAPDHRFFLQPDDTILRGVDSAPISPDLIRVTNRSHHKPTLRRLRDRQELLDAIDNSGSYPTWKQGGWTPEEYEAGPVTSNVWPDDIDPNSYDPSSHTVTATWKNQTYGPNYEFIEHPGSLEHGYDVWVIDYGSFELKMPAGRYENEVYWVVAPAFTEGNQEDPRIAATYAGNPTVLDNTRQLTGWNETTYRAPEGAPGRGRYRYEDIWPFPGKGYTYKAIGETPGTQRGGAGFLVDQPAPWRNTLTGDPQGSFYTRAWTTEAPPPFSPGLREMWSGGSEGVEMAWDRTGEKAMSTGLNSLVPYHWPDPEKNTTTSIGLGKALCFVPTGTAMGVDIDGSTPAQVFGYDDRGGALPQPAPFEQRFGDDYLSAFEMVAIGVYIHQGEYGGDVPTPTYATTAPEASLFSGVSLGGVSSGVVLRGR
jgi:hypothetical protein